MYDLVYVVSCYTRLRRGGCNVKHFAPQPADLAHAILLLLGENPDPIPSHKHLFRVWNAVLCVVWGLDRLGHLALR